MIDADLARRQALVAIQKTDEFKTIDTLIKEATDNGRHSIKVFKISDDMIIVLKGFNYDVERITHEGITIITWGLNK